MMRSTRSLALSFALVFGGGLTVGALAHRYYALKSVQAEPSPRPDPRKWRERYIGEMKTRLNLTPEQLQQLEGLLDEGRTRFEGMQKQFQTDMETFRAGQSAKVRAILRQDQIPEYEKLRKEREQRRKEMEKRKGPRPS